MEADQDPKHFALSPGRLAVVARRSAGRLPVGVPSGENNPAAEPQSEHAPLVVRPIAEDDLFPEIQSEIAEIPVPSCLVSVSST